MPTHPEPADPASTAAFLKEQHLIAAQMAQEHLSQPPMSQEQFTAQVKMLQNQRKAAGHSKKQR